jgi:hypothetical protein
MSDIEMRLLTDDVLERSSVVANCRMNRERTLTGSNGYARELGFNPFDLLVAKDCSVVPTARRCNCRFAISGRMIEQARTTRSSLLWIRITLDEKGTREGPWDTIHPVLTKWHANW